MPRCVHTWDWLCFTGCSGRSVMLNTMAFLVLLITCFPYWELIKNYCISATEFSYFLLPHYYYYWLLWLKIYRVQTICYILLEAASDDHGFNSTIQVFTNRVSAMDNMLPSACSPGGKSYNHCKSIWPFQNLSQVVAARTWQAPGDP